MENKAVGFECKFGIPVPSQYSETDDIVFVKENEHHADGSWSPRIRIWPNRKRDFYLTKPGFRKHTDKKEYEELSKLQKFTCTQKEMPERIARALNLPLNNLNMRRLARSPFVYGTDISSAALLKHQYRAQYPKAISPNTVAVLDIETDVVHGTFDILSISVTMGSKCVLVISRKFIEGINDVDFKIHAAMEKYLGKYKAERNIDLTIEIANTPGQAVQKAMQYAHAWMPDWMVVWNLNFDIKEMFKALEKEGINQADVFCDPSVPPEFRYARYMEGPQQKVTASGRTMSLNPWERWHSFLVPSSFYWICAMSTYAFIRKADGQEPSYGLDAILNKQLGERKLNFAVADGYTKLEWHQFMQANYKIEYLIYNLFDCIGVELLDDRTKDLQLTLPELTGFSEYQDFKSTPKQLADDLHFFYQEQGKVIAATSDQMATELDDDVVGMDDWIIALQTHLNVDNGLKCIEEFPDLSTLIYAWVADYWSIRTLKSHYCSNAVVVVHLIAGRC